MIKWLSKVIDTLIVSLALLSIGFVLLQIFAALSQNQIAWIIKADSVICGIFFCEFAIKFLYVDSKKKYFRSNWLNIIAMIPVTDPAVRWIRGLRLLRIARLSRASRFFKVLKFKRINLAKLKKVGIGIRKIWKMK